MAVNSDIIEITDKQVVEFLKSVGGYKEKCPNCGSKELWDHDGGNPNPQKVVIIAKASDIGTFDSGSFIIHCGNCGYYENYLAKPIVNYWANKNGG